MCVFTAKILTKHEATETSDRHILFLQKKNMRWEKRTKKKAQRFCKTSLRLAASCFWSHDAWWLLFQFFFALTASNSYLFFHQYCPQKCDAVSHLFLLHCFWDSALLENNMCRYVIVTVIFCYLCWKWERKVLFLSWFCEGGNPRVATFNESLISPNHSVVTVSQRETKATIFRVNLCVLFAIQWCLVQKVRRVGKEGYYNQAQNQKKWEINRTNGMEKKKCGTEK